MLKILSDTFMTATRTDGGNQGYYSEKNKRYLDRELQKRLEAERSLERAKNFTYW